MLDKIPGKFIVRLIDENKPIRADETDDNFVGPFVNEEHAKRWAQEADLPMRYEVIELAHPTENPPL